MEEGGKASSWDMWIPFGKEKGDGPPKGPSEPWGRVESHLFRLAMTLKETEVGVQREWEGFGRELFSVEGEGPCLCSFKYLKDSWVVDTKFGFTQIIMYMDLTSAGTRRYGERFL
jgi:hypothetical protein